MADLTEVINQHDPEHVIDAWHEANNRPRARLGLSQAGHECPRWLWYCHRGTLAQQPEGRVLRLFQLGNVIEDQVIADLRAVGYTVTREQEQVVFTWDDTVLYGHIDGVVEGLMESSKPHLLEIKSASRKRFNDLVKKRDYQAWDRKYKFQVQAYMVGLKLDRCLAVVYCKDDSRLYTERIKIDRQWITATLADVFRAITSDAPPDRACPREDWYAAKWCQYALQCWGYG